MEKEQFYLYNGNIHTGGYMHKVWMTYYMKEHKNFAVWLEGIQRVS